MDRGLEFGSVFDLHNYGRRMITEGEDKRALKVFTQNAGRHPGVWPVNYGLARIYSALGEFDRTVEFLEKAAANVPAGDTRNGPAIAEFLEKARRGEDFN